MEFSLQFFQFYYYKKIDTYAVCNIKHTYTYMYMLSKPATAVNLYCIK